MTEKKMRTYEVTETINVPIKSWTRGVPVEEKAKEQLKNVASLPFIYKHLAVMPDAHWGMGATVGSVIATRGAIIPAAVGVDLGCGMVAVQVDARAEHLPDNLAEMRSLIEHAVPHGRTDNGGPNDRGAWAPEDLGSARRGARVLSEWHCGPDGNQLSHRARFDKICEKHPVLRRGNLFNHLGTLGTGNHFVEVCTDTDGGVWVMLHSGSRGVGGRIGSYFIELAKREMERWFIHLPDKDLAYLPDGSEHFADYVEAVSWAQDFALANRRLMLESTLDAVRKALKRDSITTLSGAVQCHHNYIAKEHHFGQNVWVTRKGAVRAREGDLGIIPGSMGAKSFIVRGKGNADSFHSCSHGAGRAMSRTEAKRRFTLEDHAAATAGVECRKDADVIDETPGAYKSIDAVMAAQADLVEVVATLKQVLCVKG